MTKPPASKVISDIDYEKEGRQVSRLFMPHSHNDSAWGAVAIPVVVVKNGSGPTLLLTAGTHGDEYEGQIALLELARTLRPEQIQGRVIIIPALHFPACQVGKRLSPIDGRDINRSFPGDPAGSFAQALAHYVTNFLLPLADVNIDLHSGGRSLDCLPSTMSHILDDKAVLERTIALAKAFGAPLHVMNREVDGAHTFQSTAERMGVISMSSELGGCNRVSLDGLAIARRGIVNALVHLGIADGQIERPAEPTRAMVIPASGDYGFAPASGIYCPRVPLGAIVSAGDAVGDIYRIEDPELPPHPVVARRAGMLWCQRGQGRIQTGDSSAVVVSAYEAAP
ncbi:succinylglutamate desuccinylase/aspartoacylase family protein [Mesorhizobium sp. ASY16-5R]|uniref:succinylglutamate desuccinylase/aspartoacylase family protein n=1 Tax=Mesorhizobium sp. ASY16-5R TaxID=3445772 RepID=UPI003FA0DC7D